MNWSRVTVFLVVVFIMLALVPDSASASEPEVRVALSQRAQRLRLSGQGAWTIYDLSGKFLHQIPAGMEVVMSQGGGQVQIEGLFSAGSGIVARPDAGYLQLEGRPYRGYFRVETQDDGLLAINVVRMEEYLCGVVPREMPASWHMEALKAQAVAARTYAMRLVNQNRSNRFDLVSTVLNQVYGGLRDESTRSNQAVDATRGQVLTYNGIPILAAYHACSGGHTENVENVWGYPLPYLVGVPDRADDSPFRQWDVAYTFEGLKTYLDRANMSVGDVHEIRLEEDRGVSGRPVQVTIVGTERSRTVRADTFRGAVGLRSTFIDLEVGEGRTQLPKTRWTRRDEFVSIVGAHASDERQLTYNMAVGAGGVAVRVLDATIASPGLSAPVVLTFTGSGWGHGVGMSQYGARALAEDGYDYLSILKHYYTGVQLCGDYGR